MDAGLAWRNRSQGIRIWVICAGTRGGTSRAWRMQAGRCLATVPWTWASAVGCRAPS